MDEKQLLKFIEKLVPNLEDNRIWLDIDIKKVDSTKLKYSDVIRDKLFELGLLTETNDTFDELTTKGLLLKKLKSLKKLKKSLNKKPFDKKWIGYFLTSIIIILSLIWRCEDKSDVVKIEYSLDKDSLIDLKYNKIQEKVKPLLDTLQTKN